ncbi:MAG TPA: hypothetical protein VGD95_01605, partial [Micavibrio sp.]
MTTEHIKMPAIVPVMRTLANGTQTIFAYPFPIFTAPDLKIYLNGAPQTSGYTISGAGDSDGGTVTFATAPVAGVVVTLERKIALERMTDFLEGGDFSARAINNELDYVMASLQQLHREQTAM